MKKVGDGWLFGHYDSRGGATLFLDQCDEQKALDRYIGESFCVEAHEDYYDQMRKSLYEDSLGLCSLYADESIADKIREEYEGCCMDVLYGEGEFDNCSYTLDVGEKQLILCLVQMPRGVEPPDQLIIQLPDYVPTVFDYNDLGEDAFGLIVT